MADTEFKGELIKAELKARPDVITSPEDNEDRNNSWDGVKRYHPRMTCEEILNLFESAFDFTPEWDVDDGKVQSHNNYCKDCAENFDGVERWMYKSLEYKTPERVTSKEIFKDSGFKPSNKYRAILHDIKYSDAHRTDIIDGEKVIYWHINYFDEEKRKEVFKYTGTKVGNLTKEQCPAKKRGYALSDEELMKRAEGTGKKARNARLLLKQRSERLK